MKKYSKNFYLGVLVFLMLPSVVLAVASTSSTRVSVEVEGVIITHPIEGCTDPDAENYSSQAEVDNGSCVNVAPASNFLAIYNNSSKTVNLTWSNPSNKAYFDAVRIVRKAGSIPGSPTDGAIVYDGSGEQASDSDVDLNTRYYYALFVRSTSGRYLSPLIASVFTNEETCEDRGDCDPFINFGHATSSDPLIRSLKLGDFIFSQPYERLQYFSEGGKVIIKGNKQFTVSLPYHKVPTVLKTIGITLIDPLNPQKSFSFLLRANVDKTMYTATVAPLGRTGVYKMNIYVMNFRDQTMKKITGDLVVATAGAIPVDIDTAATLGKGLAMGTGLAAIAIQTFGITSYVASLLDIYLAILRLIGALLGFLGIKKKNKPWGTVYDAVTKRPIDPAYVSIIPVAGKEEQASAITDIDGRYGFFLPAGSYIIKAGKTHYAFPSRTLYGKDRDELYANLYFGEPVEVKGEEVVNKNIPLDPIGFDWNEFAKSKSEFFKVYSQKELRRSRVFSLLYTFGFIISIGSLILTPSWFDIFTIIIYIALFGFQKYWAARHRPVQVKNKQTGEPLPYSIIRFYLPSTNTEVRSVVADELGRFYALLRPETYYYTVDEKEADGSYRRVFTSSPVEFSRGVMSGNIEI